MRKQTTTDLDVIRKDPQRFTWGRINRIENLGPYTFVHYLQYPMGNDAGGSVRVGLYVDGAETNTSYPDLDQALVAAVAFRNTKNHTEARWAGMMALRILNIKSGD